MIAYNDGRYKTALEYFNKGIISNPIAALAYNETEYTIAATVKAPIIAGGGSVNLRIAYATCCYHLGQYDRAKIALERAIEMDVSIYNTITHYITYYIAHYIYCHCPTIHCIHLATSNCHILIPLLTISIYPYIYI